MKKIATLIIGWLTLANIAQAQTLHLQIEGLPEGTTLSIELAGTYDRYQKPIQTVTLHEGRGLFTLNAEGPRGYYIHTPDAHLNEMVVLTPGEEATLTAHYRLGKSRDEKPLYEAAELRVTGSPTHDFYLAHKANRDSLNVLYEKYHADAQPVLTELRKHQRGTAAYDSICQTPAYQRFAADEKHFFEVVESTLMAPVYANADSWWGPFFLTTEMSYLTPEQKVVYDSLSEAARNSFYGQIIQSQVCPPSKVGMTMPDFTFTDHVTGQQQSLLAICRQRRYVLVDFWASWCAPCRREIPNFKSQYALYHDRGFDIISISADTKEPDWLKALEQEQLPWYNDRDGRQGICALYQVSAYPTLYLLDAEGKVVAVNDECRGEKLGALLSKLFQQ